MSNSIFFVDKKDEFAVNTLKRFGRKAHFFEIKRYSDREYNVKLKNPVRGKNVFIIKSTAISPHSSLIELCLMIRALKRSNANHITAVIPAMCYVRDDSGVNRSPFAASLAIELLETAGMDHMVLIDCHSEQSLGFGKVTKNDIKPRSVFAKDIIKRFGHNVIISPLTYGGMFRARGYSRLIKNINIASINPDGKTISTDVSDKIIIILNDIIGSGKKIINAANVFKDAGAKEVHGYMTHSSMNKKAIIAINNSLLTSLTISDTLPVRNDSQKIRVLSLFELLAWTLKTINSDGSIEDMNI